MSPGRTVVKSMFSYFNKHQNCADSGPGESGAHGTPLRPRLSLEEGPCPRMCFISNTGPGSVRPIWSFLSAQPQHPLVPREGLSRGSHVAAGARPSGHPPDQNGHS